MRFPTYPCFALSGLLLLTGAAQAKTPQPTEPRLGSGQSNEWVEYTGDIGGKLRIGMTLCPSKEGHSAAGTYFYVKYCKDIRIAAQLNGRAIVIHEFDPAGKLTGTFTGQLVTDDPRNHFKGDNNLQGEVIAGVWSKPDGTGELPFYLSESSARVVNPPEGRYSAAGFAANAPVDAFAAALWRGGADS